MFYKKFLTLCSNKGISPAAAARDMKLSNSATTHWSKGTKPTKNTVFKVANYFGVPLNYLLDDTQPIVDVAELHPDDEQQEEQEREYEAGEFRFDRFVELCKQYGKKQSYLYELVGKPAKSGCNLKRTKKVEPEILEVWARELKTSVAYLNGETDDPTPEQKEKPTTPKSDELDEKALIEECAGLSKEQLEEVRKYIAYLKVRG